MIKIGLDNGHGLNTSGKRTPIFPNSNKFIKEWEFNYPTTKKLGKILTDHGIDVIYLSDTENDTPLRTRTSLANREKVDALVSVHFNALTGKWGNQQGIETYHYPNSKQGDRLARLIHDNLIKDTLAKDRGVKSANFFMLRESNMPGVLVECGFMDNLHEASLMLNEDYQMQCAESIAKGICEYFGVAYKEKVEHKLYRVQVGEYHNIDKAQELLRDLKSKGYNGYISETNINYPVVEIPKDTKSKYYKIGDAHIIETTPGNLEIKILGNTLNNNFGVNGVLFDIQTAKVDNPESCVMIAMNDGKPLSNNSQYNGWSRPARATLIYHTNNKLGFRQIKDITDIKDNTIWAVGGFMVKPYMDFKNEAIPAGVNYKTAHTYIGYDAEGKIYLIVKPNHMIADIVPLLNQLKITNAIVLDGGGSSQLNHPDGSFKSSRKINSAILLKDI